LPRWLEALCAGLAPGQARGVEALEGAARVSLILVMTDDGPRLWRNLCPHARWPLDTFDGRFLFAADGSLICAAHGALFDPATGACRGGPGRGEALAAVDPGGLRQTG
jgi:nitrite reductase/ring-hydroxylating ferredoxin subunit